MILSARRMLMVTVPLKRAGKRFHHLHHWAYLRPPVFLRYVVHKVSARSVPCITQNVQDYGRSISTCLPALASFPMICTSLV